jgi:hypothetical protein
LATRVPAGGGGGGLGEGERLGDRDGRAEVRTTVTDGLEEGDRLAEGL